jgi:hypothetical protein
MSRDDLTTTSYVILGFLPIRLWTTYELATALAAWLRSAADEGMALQSEPLIKLFFADRGT